MSWAIKMSLPARILLLVLQLALMAFIALHLCQAVQKYRLKTEYKRAMTLLESEHYAEARTIFKSLIWTNDAQRDLLLYDTALTYWLAKDSQGFLGTCQQLAAGQVTRQNYHYKIWAYGELAGRERKTGNEAGWRRYVETIRNMSQDMMRRYPGDWIAVDANSVLGIYDLLEGRIGEAKDRALAIEKGRSYPQSGNILMAMCYEYEKNYDAAKNEYRALMKVPPLGKMAQFFLHNLETGKSNLPEYEKMLTESVT